MSQKELEQIAEKLGVGARVTCEIEGTKITDAKLQYEYGDWYICQNVKDGTHCHNKLGYKYSWEITDEEDVENLNLHRTIEDVQVGDIVANVENNYYRVLARINDVVALSESDDDYDILRIWYTIEEMKKLGYRIFQPEQEEEPKKMTVAEIAEKLGHKVEVVEG